MRLQEGRAASGLPPAAHKHGAGGGVGRAQTPQSAGGEISLSAHSRTSGFR